MWVGLIQSVGFLTKNLTFPEGAGILPANCLWSELQLFPGSLACQPTLQIFDLPKAPTIMWISSLKSLPCPRPPPPLTHPSGPVPLRTLTTPFCYGQGLTLNSLGILPAYAEGETEVHVGWVTFSHLGARDGLKEGLNPGGEHWRERTAELGWEHPCVFASLSLSSHDFLIGSTILKMTLWAFLKMYLNKCGIRGQTAQ